MASSPPPFIPLRTETGGETFFRSESRRGFLSPLWEGSGEGAELLPKTTINLWNWWPSQICAIVRLSAHDEVCGTCPRENGDLWFLMVPHFHEDKFYSSEVCYATFLKQSSRNSPCSASSAGLLQPLSMEIRCLPQVSIFQTPPDLVRPKVPFYCLNNSR